MVLAVVETLRTDTASESLSADGCASLKGLNRALNSLKTVLLCSIKFILWRVLRILDQDQDPEVRIRLRLRILHQAKIVRKTLITAVSGLLYDFLSLRNDVNVASKNKKQKNLIILNVNWTCMGKKSCKKLKKRRPDPDQKGLNRYCVMDVGQILCAGGGGVGMWVRT